MSFGSRHAKEYFSVEFAFAFLQFGNLTEIYRRVKKRERKKKKNHNFLHFPSAVSFPSTAEIMQFGK